ncbi:unnamed protein product [Phytophthora lilii]|uniref:Unnamed protein product n=1 Tax=Phytophthora lilii TaxID=2077276 RepID=A0A9W7CQR2_9STRA|nr:unnamed protein product [Phytophthora lilii]
MIGTIYKIIHTQSDLCYVGSTLNKELKQRWKGHKDAYKNWLNDETNPKCSVYPFFKQYGIDTLKMILVKEYEVIDRTHLEAYEQLWINKLTCINRNNTIQFKKLSNKQYREDNRNRINAQKQNHYELNRLRLCEVAKAYRANNKEKVKETERNRTRPEIYTLQKIKKHNCDCGGKYTHSNRAKHFKSDKHVQWQAAQ